MQWPVIYDAKQDAFSSIQLLFYLITSFINPTSISESNYFYRSSFHLRSHIIEIIKSAKTLGRQHHELNTLKCTFSLPKEFGYLIALHLATE